MNKRLLLFLLFIVLVFCISAYFTKQGIFEPKSVRSSSPTPLLTISLKTNASNILNKHADLTVKTNKMTVILTPQSDNKWHVQVSSMNNPIPSDKVTIQSNKLQVNMTQNAPASLPFLSQNVHVDTTMNESQLQSFINMLPVK